MNREDPPRTEKLPDDPLRLLHRWLREARAAESIQYPNAMCLSTVSPEGAPQGRFVIVHSFATEGCVFLTDERSPKVRALRANPRAALTVYWPRPLERQIRIEGRVEPAPDEVADEIFHRRPRRSQATPWASRQSEPTTRAALDEELAAVDRRWEAADALPRPGHWRAYRLVPAAFEFWAARARRLHDRFLYTRDDEGWRRVRLAP